MPTITQLPAASQVGAADEVLISQNGTTCSVAVGDLLASMQPAIEVPSGALLGRVSLGLGGPEAVSIGVGLQIGANSLTANGGDHASFSPQTVLLPNDQAVVDSAGSPKLLPLAMLRGLFSAGANVAIDANGVISAVAPSVSGVAAPQGITGLPQVTAIGASDLVGISQAGADHAITYQNFLAGQTIDEAQPAVAASDLDTFWTGQGTNVMSRQTLAAVWTWVQSHLPGYRVPVVEITGNMLLDGSVHNARLLVCSAPATLSPNFLTMGSGFSCDVINLSSGSVTFAAGITTSSGSTTLSPGQSARLLAASYSGGNVVFASIATGATATVGLPGQASNLTASAPTSNSISLAWSAPSSGGAPTSYTINYRVTGQTAWLAASGSVSGTSYTVTGLSAGASYDFSVIAVNCAGSGQASTLVTATTSPLSAAPGQPSALAIASVTTSTMSMTWVPPVSGGAVASYMVNYRVSGQSAWITASAGVPGPSYLLTGLAAGASYDVEVAAVNAVGVGPSSTVVTASTAALLQAPGQPGSLSVSGTTSAGVALTWNAPGTGGAPTSYSVNYRVTGQTAWVVASNLVTATSYSVTGLSGSTSYDFEVIATNAAGSGPASTILTTSTAVALTLPGQVVGLAAENPSETSIVLYWSAPSSGGAAASYTVSFRITGQGTLTTAGSGLTATSFTVTGLSPATSYDFEVSAVNATGSGPASATITASTTAALLVPGQPTGLAVGAATSSSLSLSWSAPALGGAVGTYTINYRPTGQTTWNTASSSVTGTSYLVSSLAAGTSYDFEVIASNTAGAGVASAVVTASTAAAVASVTLSWNAAPASTYVHGTSGIVINAHADPTPQAVGFAFSTSNTTLPSVSSLSAAANFSGDIWGQYMTVPSSVGTAYLWAMATDADRNVLGTLVSGAISVT